MCSLIFEYVYIISLTKHAKTTSAQSASCLLQACWKIDATRQSLTTAAVVKTQAVVYALVTEGIWKYSWVKLWAMIRINSFLPMTLNTFVDPLGPGATAMHL